MPDMLGTGLSSLRALQRALDTTAHNIANVVDAGLQPAERRVRRRDSRRYYGTSWIGNGVNVSQVRRVYDQFLTRAERAAAAAIWRASTRSPRRPRASTTCSATRRTA